MLIGRLHATNDNRFDSEAKDHFSEVREELDAVAVQRKLQQLHMRTMHNKQSSESPYP